jgi:hypothetical protein
MQKHKRGDTRRASCFLAAVSVPLVLRPQSSPRPTTPNLHSGTDISETEHLIAADLIHPKLAVNRYRSLMIA